MARKRKISQIAMWVILAIMVVAMGGFGLNSALRSSSSDVALRVGESDISSNEYYSALVSRINNVSQQQGAPISLNEARMLGLPQQVKSQLINQATLQEIARRSHIEATDEAVKNALLEFESFKGANGAFSRNNFELFLKARGLSEKEFLDDLRTGIARNTVMTTLLGQSPHADQLTKVIAKKIGEKRNINYLVLDSTNIETPKTIDEATIRAKYDENPEAYLGEPVRTYEIAYLVPDPASVSEDEVRAEYEANAEQYSQEAQVNYDVLAFSTEEDAQAFFENPDFNALAKERGLEAADYHFENQPLSTLPEAMREIVKTEGAKVYPPQQGTLGWNVFAITNYQEANTIPLENVESNIRSIVASKKVNAVLSNEYDALTNTIAQGMSPKDIADGSSMNFVSWSNDQEPILGLTDQDDFQSEAQSAQLDEERELVSLSNGGAVYLSLMKEDEPAIRSFDEVKDEIAQFMQDEATQEALDERAAEILAMIENGESLESVSEAQSLSLESIDPIMQQESYAAMPINLAFELFEAQPNTAWISHDGDKRYVAMTTDIAPFDENNEDGKAAFEALQNEMNSVLSESLVLEYLNAAAKEFGAVEFPAVIEQIEAQINR